MSVELLPLAIHSRHSICLVVKLELRQAEAQGKLMGAQNESFQTLYR